ncbi:MULTISPECIES: galactosyltransferase-related protein [unclassified Bacteroides]|uniref:galactosyltransferase-related protein n=1 Tax=unclassified Bacteroides TaxID=2646097 RepID=UPI0013EC9F9B|nr:MULTISPECIES: galactosyltransferase-related protein [unclassified Bacteroides]QTO26233.1 hypothetical protein G7Y45_01160 [Bacteroides sp. ZJ-18]
MIKQDLSDVTFLIPIKIDSVGRLENLILSVRFLQRYFRTKIKILETGRYNSHILEDLLDDVDYRFIKDADNIYHRTKYQNILVEGVCTPYIAIWEADIIAYPEKIIYAVEQLRENRAEVAYPYNGKVLDVPMLLREYYAKSEDLLFLDRNVTLMRVLYDRVNLVGGAIFYNRNAYLDGGKDNERFYGWGNEDFERRLRWRALGYRSLRAEGPMFHLGHPRGENSKYKSFYNSLYSASLVLSTALSSEKDILNDQINNL